MLRKSDVAQAQIELVPPKDGRQENVWVLFLVLLLLTAGALGVGWRHVPSAAPTPHLIGHTPLDRQLMMELSIALDEIRFIYGMQQGQHHALDASTLLAADLLPQDPTGTSFWMEISENCLLLNRQGSPSMLLYLEAADLALYQAEHPVSSLTHCPPASPLWQQVGHHE